MKGRLGVVTNIKKDGSVEGLSFKGNYWMSKNPKFVAYSINDYIDRFFTGAVSV